MCKKLLAIPVLAYLLLACPTGTSSAEPGEPTTPPYENHDPRLAEEGLGGTFDLKPFPAEVLRQGPPSLPVLEAGIERRLTSR